MWDNPVKHNIAKAEDVQQSMAQFTCCDYKRTSRVTAMLQKLYLDSLKQHQSNCRVLVLYRIRNGLVAVRVSAYIQPATAHTRGPKPDADRSSATQMHTAIPSFILYFAG